MLAVGGGILMFAALIEPFGLVPAIAALVLVASRADGALSLPAAALAIAGASVAIVGIFGFGLGFPMKIAAWPW